MQLWTIFAALVGPAGLLGAAAFVVVSVLMLVAACSGCTGFLEGRGNQTAPGLYSLAVLVVLGILAALGQRRFDPTPTDYARPQ